MIWIASNHWSIIIDTENSLVYFQTSHCRNIKFFSFKNFDFSSTTPVMMFDLNSNLSGDVSKLFLPYSFQRNKQLVTEAAKYVDSLGLRIKLLFSFSTQGNMIDRLARCPDSTIKIRKRKYKKLVW